MNLEDHVCSLEYARRLKELGVPQVSLFYWVKHKSWAEYQLLYIDDLERHFPGRWRENDG